MARPPLPPGGSSRSSSAAWPRVRSREPSAETSTISLLRPDITVPGVTRNLLRALAAVVVLAAAGLIGWRVLAPAEVVETATEPYPVALVRRPGVMGKL